MDQKDKNEVIESPGKGIFRKNLWDELARTPIPAFSLETITDIIEDRRDISNMSREEVKQRVINYFQSCLRVYVDEDTNEEQTVWVKPPTKQGLALALNISKETLSRYLGGMNNGSPYGNSVYSRAKVKTEDFDIIQKAADIITDYYEGELGKNKNNSGTIFWLLNSRSSEWSNNQEITVVNGNDQKVNSSTAEDIQRRLLVEDKDSEIEADF